MNRTLYIQLQKCNINGVSNFIPNHTQRCLIESFGKNNDNFTKAIICFATIRRDNKRGDSMKWLYMHWYN